MAWPAMITELHPDLDQSITALHVLLDSERSAVARYEQVMAAGFALNIGPIREGLTSHQRSVDLLIERMCRMGGDPMQAQFQGDAEAGRPVSGRARSCTHADLATAEEQVMESYHNQLVDLDLDSLHLVTYDLLPERRRIHDLMTQQHPSEA